MSQSFLPCLKTPFTGFAPKHAKLEKLVLRVLLEMLALQVSPAKQVYHIPMRMSTSFFM
jgi:hypothetical protein